jgi:hypothetical protein
MALRTELIVRLPNSPGAAAGVCRLLAEERVNIAAILVESTGQLHLVVDNHVRASGVLRDAHYRVNERDVLMVALSNTPGSLAAALTLAADAGINVNYLYGSTPASETAAVVVGVDDARKAAAATGL